MLVSTINCTHGLPIFCHGTMDKVIYSFTMHFHINVVLDLFICFCFCFRDCKCNIHNRISGLLVASFPNDGPRIV